MDLLDLYRVMARIRAFELAQGTLWSQGLIGGEMHLGTGEEALVAGLASHLREGDATAIDHRSTPMMVARGVDLASLLREVLGHEGGLCGGRGGHMHLFSKGHLAASSGIVGAAGPVACGFALAGARLRPGTVAIALFGDGAINQGMLLESFNLAVAWSLPVLFVCKDNGWAITTRSATVTGGDLVDRARGFGMPSRDVDGLDPLSVRGVSGPAFERARRGEGPSFLRATCSRLDGHFLGDLMVRVAASPLGSGRSALGEVVAAAVSSKGAGLGQRAASVAHMLGLFREVRREHRDDPEDPLAQARRALASHSEEVRRIDEEVHEQVDAAVAAALGPTGRGATHGAHEVR